MKYHAISRKSILFFKKSYFSKKSESVVLVTGCSGQIGSSLVPRFYERYGVEKVICTDISEKPSFVKGEYHKLDVSNHHDYKELAFKHKINTIIHLAALLSGNVISHNSY